MGNILTKGSGKFIKTEPRFPGDLGYNLGSYMREPDFNNLDDKQIAMMAEIMAATSSLTRENSKVAMMIGSVTSGVAGYETAMRNPVAIKEYTEGKFGEGFLTIVDLPYVLSKKGVMEPEVFAKTKMNQVRAAGIANTKLPEGYVLDVPFDKEEMLRAISGSSDIASKSWDDWTFEMHYWLPKIFLDTDRMIYCGDKSFSRNGSLEQAAALSIQYGLYVPLIMRGDRGNMDVTDINGNDISPVDQAWEDAKHIVNVVEKDFRTETAVALLLTRFMYENWRRKNINTDNGIMVPEHMHDSVKKQSRADIKKMNELTEMMLLYIANKCDWKTLHRILDNDPDLKKFWDDKVVPLKDQELDMEKLEGDLFSYIPRGGYEYNELDIADLTYRDAPSASNQFARNNKRSRAVKRQIGIHKTPFCPNRCNNVLYPNSSFLSDYNRLGVTGDPKAQPVAGKRTRSQIVAYLTATAIDADRESGNRYLYLDDTASGERAANFINNHKIADWRDAPSYHSPSKNGGRSFYQDVIKVNIEKYKQRFYQILNMNDFKDDNDIGSILPLSTIKEMTSEFEGRRKSINAYRKEAIAADGPEKVGEAANVIAKAIDYQGIIIPKGAVLNDNQCAHILNAVMMATGQVEETYEGDKYNMHFFYDDETDLPPREIDFGDLLLLVGKPMKHALEQGCVLDHKAIVYTAQMFDMYEKLFDPARRNTGDFEVDWNQIHASNPNFSNFTQDKAKAKEVHDLWNDLVGVVYENDRVVAKGKILENGMHAFDRGLDLPSMSSKYTAARDALDNRIAMGGKNSINTNARLVKTPRGGF